MSAKTKLPNWDEAVAAGGHIVLYGTTWETYEQFDAYFEELSFGRVSYCDGILEIMPNSKLHERMKVNLARLIQDYALWMGHDFSSAGQATIGEQEKDASKEPDDSFWFNREMDERADLILEVVITSPAIEKQSFYARFGIPELWIWEDGRIQVWLLKKDGKGYKKSKRSQIFPNLDLRLMERCAQSEILSQAIREFRRGLEAGA